MGFPEKYLKMRGVIIKWPSGNIDLYLKMEGGGFTIKWEGVGYDHLPAFTGNGQYTYITFGTDVLSNMIMIVCVNCSFGSHPWFSFCTWKFYQGVS